MSGTGVAGGEPLTKRAKQTPPRLGDADAPRRDTSITVATVMRAQEAGGGDGSASEQLGAGLRHLPHQDQHGHHVAWAAGVEDQQRNGHSPQPPSGGRDMAPARRRTASVSDPRANHAALVAAAAAAAAAETSGGKQGEEEEGDLTEEEERARQSQLRNLMKRPSFGHILNTLRQGKEELALRHDDANQPNAAVATDSQPIKAEASQTAAVRPLGPTTTPGPHGSPGSQMQANHARVAVQAVQAVSAAAVSGLPPQHMQSSPPVRHPPFQSPPAGGPAPVHKGQVQQPLQFQPQRVPQPMRQPAQHPPKNASPNAQMVAGGAMQPVAHGMAPQAFGLHPAVRVFCSRAPPRSPAAARTAACTARVLRTLPHPVIRWPLLHPHSR